jgi:hypothetical protein
VRRGNTCSAETDKNMTELILYEFPSPPFSVVNQRTEANGLEDKEKGRKIYTLNSIHYSSL